jgi:HK97 family phage prohead protease
MTCELAEVRVEESADGRRVIRGAALRYGSLSNPLRDAKNRPFREKFRAGAFSRALATGADVRALVGHDRTIVLGRNTAGTMRLSDDADALRFEIDPPDTAIGEHYRVSAERGDMRGVSIKFYKVADIWTGAGEATTREVTEADLEEISLTAFPAYGDTEAATRSLDEHAQAVNRPDPWVLKARFRLRLAEAQR